MVEESCGIRDGCGRVWSLVKDSTAHLCGSGWSRSDSSCWVEESHSAFWMETDFQRVIVPSLFFLY